MCLHHQETSLLFIGNSYPLFISIFIISIFPSFPFPCSWFHENRNKKGIAFTNGQWRGLKKYCRYIQNIQHMVNELLWPYGSLHDKKTKHAHKCAVPFHNVCTCTLFYLMMASVRPKYLVYHVMSFLNVSTISPETSSLSLSRSLGQYCSINYYYVGL